MAYEHKNVIVGAAALFISAVDSSDETGEWTKETGPVGPALPTWKSGTKASSTLDGSAEWNSMGYTTDGVEVSYEPDYGEVTVDQALDSVKMYKQGMRVAVNTTLAEATLDNLMIAWGQKGGPVEDGGTLDDSNPDEEKLAIAAGELGDDPIERALAFVGNAPKGVGGKQRERIYHVRRALQVETSAHSLSRADATTFPVSFRCMADDGVVTSGQEYGVIVQRVIKTA